MGYDYTKVADASTRLITRFGRDATFRYYSTTTESGQEWLGNNSRTEAASTVLKVLESDPNSDKLVKELVESGGFVSAKSVLLCVVPSDGYDIVKTTEIVDNGKTYGVVAIMPLSPGDTPLLYAVVVSE